jgi:hypothetical protein
LVGGVGPNGEQARIGVHHRKHREVGRWVGTITLNGTLAGSQPKPSDNGRRDHCCAGMVYPPSRVSVRARYLLGSK